MIYLIGTCHKTQIWNDLVRKQPLGVVPLAKINAFQQFVTEAAIALDAATIGEEMNEERMLTYGHNAITVAQLVARQLNIVHVFCQPNETERQALHLRAGDEMVQHAKTIAARTAGDWVQVHGEEVRKQFRTRETFWAERLARHYPKANPVLFICGPNTAQPSPKPRARLASRRSFIVQIGRCFLKSPARAVCRSSSDD